MIDMVILGFLSLKKLTAYDIKKALDKSVNHFYSTSYGSIHPALVKLEKNNMINSKEFKEDGRSKKLYSINKSGIEKFQNWLGNDIAITRLKEDALVKIFFFGMVKNEKRKEIINNYLNEIDEWISKLTDLKQSFKGQEIPENFKEIAHFQFETLRFGIDYGNFAKKWFDDFNDRNQ